MKPFTIVTGLLASDLNIIQTAESLIPLLSEGKASWLIKVSNETMPDFLLDYQKIKGVKIVCEPDMSLYEGLNQALRHVDGEFFMVVGAGDTFERGAVDLIHKSISENPNLDSFFFGVTLVKNGQHFYPRPSEMHVRMACPHPGALLNTQKTIAISGFDERYQIASDYDLLSRYLQKHGACGWLDVPVVKYKGGGISEVRGVEAYLEEELVRLRVWKTGYPELCQRAIRLFTHVERASRGPS